MLKSYKYCLLPNDEQKEQLSKFFGHCRFVYNLGLETKIAAWVSAKKYISFFDLAKQMKDLKDTEAKWLSECPAQTLQYSLRNLDNAYTRFFRQGSGFPKFKNKYSKQSVQFPQDVYIKNDLVYIPKLKGVKFIQHRAIGIGKIKTTTVSKTTTGKYFISFSVENDKTLPTKKVIKEKSSIGIDVGLKTFATLSDSQQFANPRYLEAQLKRLRVEQRKLSRRFKKGSKEQSNSYNKQKIVVAKLHEKIANQRKDFLHKTSTAIVKQYDTICIEDLNIQGMQQNRKLSKAISSVSWHKFFTMLQYKSEWSGKNVITIGRFEPSSKICSNCGNIFKELNLSIRDWTCDKCGTNHDRDINAALNIKNFALKNHL